MLDWLRRIDDVIFAPPHRFETILAFVVLRLGLAFNPKPTRASEKPPRRNSRGRSGPREAARVAARMSRVSFIAL